jgi:hypothetical protein
VQHCHELVSQPCIGVWAFLAFACYGPLSTCLTQAACLGFCCFTVCKGWQPNQNHAILGSGDGALLDDVFAVFLTLRALLWRLLESAACSGPQMCCCDGDFPWKHCWREKPRAVFNKVMAVLGYLLHSPGVACHIYPHFM